MNDGDIVLDVGCANGYSTIQYGIRKNTIITGVDYIPEMIKQAENKLGAVGAEYKLNVEFAVSDITDLQFDDESFDKIIVTRVIINLGEWTNQVKGINECIRVLKRGGVLLLSEATLQGWEKLNKFRNEWHLPDIPMPPFNNYIDQEKLIDAVKDELKLLEIVDFASTYYLGTRVLKPLIIEALKLNIDVANPDMEWNKFFAKLPCYGDYGTQKLFVLKKI